MMPKFGVSIVIRFVIKGHSDELAKIMNGIIRIHFAQLP
jgi:hypothetical protein